MHQRIDQFLKERAATYIVRRHCDCDVAIHSPNDFARAIGYPQARVTKTLFLRSRNDGAYCLIVLPSDRRANLHRVGECIGKSPLELASRTDLELVLGFPPTAVSPLGARAVSVVVDTCLMAFETILVGSGVIGIEIEIAPQTLASLVGAKVISISDL